MTLRNEQSEFAKRLPLLLLYIIVQGYEITFGDFKATTGHSENSFHYKRLAADINLFKDGKYLKLTEDHKQFGLFWENLGGSWGGRWNDGNHYSWGEDGSSS